MRYENVKELNAEIAKLDYEQLDLLLSVTVYNMNNKKSHDTLVGLYSCIWALVKSLDLDIDRVIIDKQLDDLDKIIVNKIIEKLGGD